MAVKLSRTKLARYVASEIQAGNKDILRQLAAYLVDENRVKEVDLLLRSIYDELEREGIVIADVVSVNGVDADAKANIQRLLGADQLVLREQTDPSVLGGVKVTTPSRVLDATLRHRITKLHERKV